MQGCNPSNGHDHQTCLTYGLGQFGDLSCQYKRYLLTVKLGIIRTQINERFYL